MDQSRREALKKLGIGTGVAWAAPAVTVLVVPTHAQATSSSGGSTVYTIAYLDNSGNADGTYTFQPSNALSVGDSGTAPITVTQGNLGPVTTVVYAVVAIGSATPSGFNSNSLLASSPTNGSATISPTISGADVYVRET